MCNGARSLVLCLYLPILLSLSLSFAHIRPTCVLHIERFGACILCVHIDRIWFSFSGFNSLSHNANASSHNKM